MAVRLTGKEVAERIRTSVKERAEALQKRGVFPMLGILRLGERPDDLAYEQSAVRQAGKLGIGIRHIVLPETAGEEELYSAIRQVNEDPSVHGLLMLRPLPDRIMEERACALLDPSKDIDGITPGSAAGIFLREPVGFAPCTAQGCMEILSYYGIPVEGARAVVVGRSAVIGRPVSLLLLKQNATVTICHTRTRDLPAVCREADILIAALGHTGVIGADCLREGQTVIDVGIHVEDDGRMHGDVDETILEQTAAAYTPVPGGVGSVTTAVLLSHLIEAAERQMSN